jgi:hypothetical protein
MRADFDSQANAISITLIDADLADRADQIDQRTIVALRDDQPVEFQVLYPDLGLDGPLRAVADRYGLDIEALIAAASAALAAPDRAVTLDVAVGPAPSASI